MRLFVDYISNLNEISILTPKMIRIIQIQKSGVWIIMISFGSTNRFSIKIEYHGLDMDTKPLKAN